MRKWVGSPRLSDNIEQDFIDAVHTEEEDVESLDRELILMERKLKYDYLHFVKSLDFVVTGYGYDFDGKFHYIRISSLVDGTVESENLYIDSLWYCSNKRKEFIHKFKENIQWLRCMMLLVKKTVWTIN